MADFFLDFSQLLGIYTAHSAFGGRASWGATYGGYASADGNGHGTREYRAYISSSPPAKSLEF